jgi:hypothetical protein
MADRIKLEKGDFYELRALRRDVDAIELEAMRSAETIKARITVAHQRVNEALNLAVAKYGLDPAVTYTWDDATCELIASNGPQDRG